MSTLDDVKRFRSLPIDFSEVKALQNAFDPAGLAFSEEYYDTLDLERPGQ